MTISYFENARCLKCGVSNSTMVFVHVFTMCKKCYADEFKTDVFCSMESETYLKWLDKYKEL